VTNFRLLLLQRAGLFSSLVPDCTAVRVCFDFAAWPHYTTPSLFSSFSINEAETFKKQMPDASGGNSPKCSKVWNFLSVVTIISRIKWSCCLDTRFGKATIACNLICYPRWIAWISDRHLSKLKKKNGHFGHKIFIGKLLNYRSNRYLYVLPEVWIVMIWLIKKSPRVNASLYEAENTWFSCKQRGRALPKGTLCLRNYSTVTLTLACHNVV